MKRITFAIALMMITGVVGGATLPEPMLTYPNDTIFSGRLLDTLWCPHDSGTVFYTTDGSTPTTVSPFVGAGGRWPFSFDSTVTLKAFSWWRTGSGDIISSTFITVKYTKKLYAPINYQPAGTFIDSIKIEFARPESGATIHFTTDGSIPDSTSTTFTLPIVLKETTTLKYMAMKRNCLPSDILTRVYEKISANIKNRAAGFSQDNTLIIIPSRSTKNNLLFAISLAQQDKVTICICDFKGRSIATIANDIYNKGTHELSWAIGNIPRGIYLIKMNTLKGIIVKRYSLVH